MSDRETQNAPLMTIIITTVSGGGSMRVATEHLKKQTVAADLEIIILGPSGAWPDGMEDNLAGFYGYEIMDVDLDNGLYYAWADAIKKARAPIVAFGENHAFPEPEWAEAVIEAHKGPWTAVGSVFKNANPYTGNSWVQLYMTYGQYTEPIRSGEVGDLHGHNGTYKRDALLEYGDRLGNILVRANILHMDLRAKGHRLYMEDKAVIHHVNVSKTVSIILDLFYNGWLYTAALADYKGLSRLERLKGIVMEPPIIAKHFLGTLGSIRRAGKSKELLPRTLPIITAGLISHMAGKIWGYIAGNGNAQRYINSYEFDRYKYITAEDIEHIEKLA
ncbi:MAG: glycosyltransferase [Candidatus Dadabacteria bacterium]